MNVLALEIYRAEIILTMMLRIEIDVLPVFSLSIFSQGVP